MIEIPLITRVEGHGHLSIKIEDGSVDVNFGIHEGPRYFEAILVGRKWYEVPEIACRICGICTVIHAMCAAQAVENAANFQDELLETYRNLMIYSSHIQSHVLHLYFLAWPDFVRKDSVISAYPEYGGIIKKAFKMKGIVNELTEIFGARKTHPATVVPGRFTKDITIRELEYYVKKMKEILPLLKETAELFSQIEYPDIRVDGVHLALTDDRTVPLYHGDLKIFGGERFSPVDYKNYIQEKVVPPNTTKRSYYNGKPIMVGALPRLNINHRYLREEAKEFFSSPSENIMHNNLAQAVECYHYGLVAIETAEELIAKRREYISRKVDFKFRNSEGIAAVEAPRGVLIHHYILNGDEVKYTNIITPTAINFEHIERAVYSRVVDLINQDEETIKFEAEKVIRAYDPCISCSAHVVKITKN